MYMKEPEKCYRYNDAEDADFTKIVDPKHTALLMIDMQNDFCSPKGNVGCNIKCERTSPHRPVQRPDRHPPRGGLPVREGIKKRPDPQKVRPFPLVIQQYTVPRPKSLPPVGGRCGGASRYG